jgi:hypothetical protein
MDFGGFILFALIALGLLVGSLLIIVAFMKRSPRRWHGLGLWLSGFVLMIVFGSWLYQVYWLDERLFIAAAKGNLAQVNALLTAGASPNATWEDGTSALAVAQAHNDHDVLLVLKKAGANNKKGWCEQVIKFLSHGRW